MIRQKTLLVLGAGASMDYGFPSGENLIDEIINYLDGVDSTKNIKHKILLSMILKTYLHWSGKNEALQFCYETVDVFYELLVNSSPASIDDFIFQVSKIHEYFGILGKILIILMITKYEEKQNSFLTELTDPPKGNKHYEGKAYKQLKRGWYSYFWKKLYEGSEIDGLINSFKNLTVVSFNYDRSLEYFLHSRIINMFGKTPEEATQLLGDNLLIHHVYGQLGILNLQNKTHPLYALSNEYEPINTSNILNFINEIQPNTNTFKGDLSNELSRIVSVILRPQVISGTFGFQINRENDDPVYPIGKICYLASKIKTYHENTDGAEPQIDLLRSRLHGLHACFFLGFGYLQQNLEWLAEKIFKNISNFKMYGTIYGFGTAQYADMINRLSNLIGPMGKNIDWMDLSNRAWQVQYLRSQIEGGYSKLRITDFFKELKDVF